jgi:DNA-binding transcriptional MerR regulator
MKAQRDVIKYAYPIHEYFSNESVRHFSEFLHKEKIQMKLVGKEGENISSRVLNHWEKMRLIPLGQPRATGTWRSFNLIEAVWLASILKLRQGGMPLGGILEVKRALKDTRQLDDFYQEAEALKEKLIDRYMVSTNPILEVAIFRIWYHKKAMYLVCHLDGGAEILSHDEYLYKMNQGEIKDHTAILLNTIVQGFFPKKDLSPRFMEMNPRVEDVLKIMNLIYKTAADKVEITMKDGSVKLVEITKSEDAAAAVEVLLNKADYQRVTVVKHGGKRVHLERTEQIKF